MSSAELALQGAINFILRNDGGVAALVEVRVYDPVPDGAAFPYISFGPSQDVRQDADCFSGLEVFQQVDVWSRSRGFAECKRIEAAVIAALHGVEATKDGLRFDIEHRTTNTFRDGDGLTAHGALSFRAEIYEFNE